MAKSNGAQGAKKFSLVTEELGVDTTPSVPTSGAETMDQTVQKETVVNETKEMPMPGWLKAQKERHEHNKKDEKLKKHLVRDPDTGRFVKVKPLSKAEIAEKEIWEVDEIQTMAAVEAVKAHNADIKDQLLDFALGKAPEAKARLLMLADKQSIIYGNLAMEEVLERLKKAETRDRQFVTQVPLDQRVKGSMLNEVFSEISGQMTEMERNGRRMELNELRGKYITGIGAYLGAWSEWEGQKQFRTFRDKDTGQIKGVKAPEATGKASGKLSTWDVMHHNSLWCKTIEAETTQTREVTDVTFVRRTNPDGTLKRDNNGKLYPFMEVKSTYLTHGKLTYGDEDAAANRAYQNGDPFWHEVDGEDIESMDDMYRNQRYVESCEKDVSNRNGNGDIWGGLNAEKQVRNWAMVRGFDGTLFADLVGLKARTLTDNGEYTYKVEKLNEGGWKTVVTAETKVENEADWINKRGELAYKMCWYNYEKIKALAIQKAQEKGRYLSEEALERSIMWWMGLREKNRFLGDQQGRLWSVFVEHIQNLGKDVISRYAEHGLNAVTKHTFQRLSPVQGSLKREKPIAMRAMFGKEGDKRTWCIKVPQYLCFNCSKNNEQECQSLGARGLATKRGRYWATPHLNDVAPMGHFQEIILGHKPTFKLNGTKEVYRCVVCGLPKATKSFDVTVKTFANYNGDDIWFPTFRIHGEVAEALLQATGWMDKVWSPTPYYGQAAGAIKVAEWRASRKPARSFLANY